MLSLSHTLTTLTRTIALTLLLLLSLPFQKCRVDLSTELDDRAVLLFALCYFFMYIVFLLAGLLHTVVAVAAVV